MALFGTKKKTRRKSKKKKQSVVAVHLKSLGFTNRLAVFIMLFLAVGLCMGFYLANKSIAYGYTGALVCFTVVFTPLGTALGIVLNSVVAKSRAENSGGNGDGIKYALAMAQYKQDMENTEAVEEFENSPPI